MTKMEDKVQECLDREKWKLVDRLSNKVYHNNISYEEGEKLLHSDPSENKMLIPVNYRFQSHSTMGSIWSTP